MVYSLKKFPYFLAQIHVELQYLACTSNTCISYRVSSKHILQIYHIYPMRRVWVNKIPESALYGGGVAMSVTIEILTYLAVVWDKRKIMQIYEFMSALTYSVGYNYHYNNAITNSFLKYSSIFTLLKSLILLQVTYKSWGVIILDGFGISKGLQNRISLQQLILQFSLLMINFFSW